MALEQGSGDNIGLGGIYMNIGVIYSGQGLQYKAKEMYEKSLALLEEDGYERGVAVVLNNLAAIYQMLGDLDSSKQLYELSLKIREGLGDNYGIARTLDNMSELLRIQSEFQDAEHAIRRSFAIKKKIGFTQGVANSYLDLAQLYLSQKSFKKAKLNADTAWQIAQNLEHVQIKRDLSLVLYQIEKGLGNYQESLAMHESYLLLEDSIQSEGLKEKLAKQEAHFEFEKAQIIKEQKLKEQMLIEKQATERRDLLQYAIILIVLLLAFVFIISASRFQLKASQVEGLCFLVFLIFFEFILVFADPYVEEWTGGAPGFKLAINSGLALLIIPVHGFFEKLLKRKALNEVY